MPLSYYPGMDDLNHTNKIHRISPSVPHVDDEIPVPPPSPDKSNILPPPRPPTKGMDKEKDGSTVGGRLMDIAKDGSDDGTITPTYEEAGTIPPIPTKHDACTFLPAPTETEAASFPPAPTETEAGTTPLAPTCEEADTTPANPTDPKQ